MEKNHEVLAIAPRDEYTPRIMEWGCDFRELRLSGSSINPFSDIRALLTLIRILKEERIDVLLTYTIKVNIYGTLAARWTGVPNICNVSGLGTVFLSRGLASIIAKLLYRLTFRKASFIFFQNDEDRTDFMKLVPLKMDKTDLVPGSGIDLTEFSKIPYKPRERVIFLMISRLIIEKGVLEFAEAADLIGKDYPEADFWIVGELDPDHKRTIDPDLVKDWRLKGNLTYFTYTDQIRDHIAKADVIVLPSYREGTPRTLLEGGACGRALIATDVPGCRHVVDNGRNGFLCLPKDARDLSKKMIAYLELSNSDKINMGKESRMKVEMTFDETIVIDKYLQKIDELTT